MNSNVAGDCQLDVEGIFVATLDVANTAPPNAVDKVFPLYALKTTLGDPVGQIVNLIAERVPEAVAVND